MTLDPQPASAEALVMADNAVNTKYGTRKFYMDSEAGRLWQAVYESSLRVLVAAAKEEG